MRHGADPIPFLRLSDTNAPLADELKRAACRVIESGWYLHGPETKALEEELARMCGTKCCVAVSNGLDALRLIVRAYIDLGRLAPGDEVLYPADTYIASVLPLVEMGLKPVAVDPNPVDFGLDFSRLTDRAGECTRAVMTVHLYGNPSWDEEVMAKLRQRGLLILEDNAQAIGARTAAGRMTGSLGDAAAFSFYPTKNIGALGDAGAVTTDDEQLAARIRALANYGSDRRYHNICLGYNCRMDEMQAAMLRVKLRHLDQITDSRRDAAMAYDQAISHPDVTKPAIIPEVRQVWHQYILLTPRRQELMDHLAAHGVQTDITYAVPPHRQPCLRGRVTGDFALADHLASQILNLPIANVTPAQARQVAHIINSLK